MDTGSGRSAARAITANYSTLCRLPCNAMPAAGGATWTASAPGCGARLAGIEARSVGPDRSIGIPRDPCAYVRSADAVPALGGRHAALRLDNVLSYLQKRGSKGGGFVLRRLEAVQFIGDVGSGRTLPVIAAAEDAAGDVHEVVLKFASRCDLGTNSLTVEVIAACLAGSIGLPISEPFLVDLSPDWRETLPPDIRRRVSEFDNLAFGSRLIFPQWPAWTVASRLSPAMVQTAAEILAFDAFVENVDRREGNPNCLVSGDQIRIFDHELAFPRGLIGGRPWSVGGMNPLTQPPGRHIFHDQLVSQGIDLPSIRAKWAALRDEDIDEYGAAVPAEWHEAGFVGDILTKIRQVRDNLTGCMAELERILR